MLKYTKPKYAKYSEVTTPNGKGTINMIYYDQGVNWYGIKLNSNKVTKFYAEVEINSI
jgi:hypothetical protein